jgi:glycosyltransferase involved in cell wall biosynthesis
LRERLRRNARILVETHYDWETIGARFVALVEETVKGKKTDRQIRR